MEKAAHVVAYFYEHNRLLAGSCNDIKDLELCRDNGQIGVIISQESWIPTDIEDEITNLDDLTGT